MEFLIVALAAVSIGFVLGFTLLKSRLEADMREGLHRAKEEGAQDALKRSSATLKGQIGERFAPFVRGFGFQPADARFLGSPIDYIVFDGMADGQVMGVTFVELKTGRLPLTPFQKQVRDAIQLGRVGWKVVELDE
jgi:predicted Holliday junction resolvase-like endonuclease